MPKAFDRVRIARKVSRPTSLDYITHIFEDFIEFHGDRNFADDKAIVGGIASLNGATNCKAATRWRFLLPNHNMYSLRG